MNIVAIVAAFLIGGAAGAALAWGWSQRAAAAANASALQQMQSQLEMLLPRVAEPILGAKAEQLASGARAEQRAIETLVQGIEKRLGEYQGRITDFEKERAAEAARFTQQMATLAATGTEMAREAQGLRGALTTAGGVRGRWGEQALRNLLDTCGMTEGVDYELQQREAGGQPDFIIRVASGSNLIVDAKANLAEFENGINAPDETARRACFLRFAAVLKGEAAALAKRDYPAHIADSLPLVVMFVAGEGAFRAALDADPNLIRDCQKLRPPVLLASPSTLFPMLQVIGYGFQQRRLSQQAQQLHTEVVEFGRRLRVYFSHVNKIGKALGDAAKAYQAAGSSLQTRLVPAMRRLEDLGADWRDVETPRPLDPGALALEPVSNDDHTGAAAG